MNKKFLQIQINSDGDFAVGGYENCLIEIFDGENPVDILKKELPKIRRELYPSAKLKKDDYKMHWNLSEIINKIKYDSEDILNDIANNNYFYMGLGNQEFSISVENCNVKTKNGRLIVELGSVYN